MPDIKTAEQAINAADSFLSKYYNFTRPITAKKEGDSWLVVFDVGAIRVQKVELRIDTSSGAILEYNDLSNQ